jgi:hypothetical protein
VHLEFLKQLFLTVLQFVGEFSHEAVDDFSFGLLHVQVGIRCVTDGGVVGVVLEEQMLVFGWGMNPYLDFIFKSLVIFYVGAKLPLSCATSAVRDATCS